MRKTHLILLACSMLAPFAAQASDPDVIVMRRAVVPSQGLTIVHQAIGHWVLGPPVLDAPACSSAAPATMSLSCEDPDGAALSADRCSGSPPSTSTTVADYGACTYDWVLGVYGDWSPTCSANAVRSRSVSCLRSDGTTVDGSLCDQSADHSASDEAAYYGGCTGGWKSSTSTGYCVNKLKPTTTSWSCYADGGSGSLVQDGSVCDPTKRPADTTVNAACTTTYTCPAMTKLQAHNGSIGSVLGYVTYNGDPAQAAIDGHTICENSSISHTWCTMKIPANAVVGAQIAVGSGSGGSYLSSSDPTSYSTFTCSHN